MEIQDMFRLRQQNSRKRHEKKSDNKSSENLQKLKSSATTAADQNRFYEK